MELKTTRTKLTPASLLSLVLLGAFSGPALGTVTYSFAFDQPAYTVERGTAIAIPVYLVETATAPAPSLLVAESGLSSAGITLLRTSATGNAPSFFNGTASVQSNTVDFF